MKHFICVIGGFGVGSSHSFLKIERAFRYLVVLINAASQSRVSERFQNRMLLQTQRLGSDSGDFDGSKSCRWKCHITGHLNTKISRRLGRKNAVQPLERSSPCASAMK